MQRIATVFGEADGDIDPEWPGYMRPTPFSEDARAVLADIADHAAAAGIKVVFMRLPEFVRTYRESPAQHEDVSKVLQSIAQPRGIPVIDLAAPGSPRRPDAVLRHPSRERAGRSAALAPAGPAARGVKAAEQSGPRDAAGRRLQGGSTHQARSTGAADFSVSSTSVRARSFASYTLTWICGYFFLSCNADFIAASEVSNSDLNFPSISRT